MEVGTPGRWGNLFKWGKKNNPPLHAILQPCHPMVHFLKIIEWSLSTETRKTLANHVFWRLMIFYTHLLLLLQPSMLWLSIVTFNNDAKRPPKWILREFDVSRVGPRLGGLPHLETVTWPNLTPAERETEKQVDLVLLQTSFLLLWKFCWENIG